MTGASINARRVMVERHHGWEGASPALLARVFGTSVQQAAAICRERCAVCARPICGHSDVEFAGIVPSTNSPGLSGFDRAGGPHNGHPARKGQRSPGAAQAGTNAVKVGNGAPHHHAAGSDSERDGGAQQHTSGSTAHQE